jgi:hypothetical protein
VLCKQHSFSSLGDYRQQSLFCRDHHANDGIIDLTSNPRHQQEGDTGDESTARLPCNLAEWNEVLPRGGACDKPNEGRGGSGSKKKSGVRRHFNQLNSPDFFVGIDAIGSPETPPSGQHIRAFLTERLAGSNRNEILALLEQEDAPGFEALPRWRYEHDGWTIDFFPLPKSSVPSDYSSAGFSFCTRKKRFEVPCNKRLATVNLLFRTSSP